MIKLGKHFEESFALPVVCKRKDVLFGIFGVISRPSGVIHSLPFL